MSASEETTRIVVSFYTPQFPRLSQGPYMMIVREYWQDGKVTHAEVLHKAETVEERQAVYEVEEL